MTIVELPEVPKGYALSTTAFSFEKCTYTIAVIVSAEYFQSKQFIDLYASTISNAIKSLNSEQQEKSSLIQFAKAFLVKSVKNDNGIENFVFQPYIKGDPIQGILIHISQGATQK